MTDLVPVHQFMENEFPGELELIVVAEL